MLQRMRERAGFSQTQLAEKLDLTPGRVWQLECGTVRNAPSLKTIARWARACGETVELASSGERETPDPLRPEVEDADHDQFVLRELV